MCKWRSAAGKGMSQNTLDDNYSVITDTIQHRHNPTGQGKQKFRRTQGNISDTNKINDDESTSSTTQNSQNEHAQKKLRVRLAKSNDIITERDA